jgi:phosphomannomutase
MSDLLEKARRWLAQDPDPAARAELEPLIASEPAELRERFAGPLEFGTAGLRGLIGAGESRMNRAVVRRTTAGLAAYLKATHEGPLRVVIGYDARRKSDVFAWEAAGVLAAAGITVHLSEGLCPTPLAAFAVRELGAAAGIVVTASHNPPDYNGYKVFAKNGAQIVPPADQAIAEAIAAAPPADAVPLFDLDEAERQGLLHRFGASVERRYLEAIRALAPHEEGDRSLAIAYTPLHGVGAPLVTTAFTEAGFSNLHVEPSQAEPDGRFPTVQFPNPEEPGAMDAVVALAHRLEAPLVIANDPDADRLAVAVRQGDGYIQLTGNEVGVLLGHYAIAQSAGDDRLVIATVVSSPLLGRIAADLGVAYAETLTGFKWIANRAMELEASEGKRFVFGYEEALGYCVGRAVRDKDGISAALVIATLAATLHARGETLLDELERIWRRWGFYASGQRSIAFPGASGKQTMATLMGHLRAAPPAHFDGARVIAVRDCLRGVRICDGEETPLDLPQSDVIAFELEGGHRVIARPSGTEPKMKIYFDVRETLDGEVAVARARAAARIERLRAEIVARIDGAGPSR